jgi:hypothetical protein
VKHYRGNLFRLPLHLIQAAGRPAWFPIHRLQYTEKLSDNSEGVRILNAGTEKYGSSIFLQ